MNRRVLVVDDDPEAVRQVVEALEAHRYEVLLAADGDDTLRQVASERSPWVVIAGETLSDMSGLDLVAAIRREAPGPPPGIILLTARRSPHGGLTPYFVGPEMYLAKPFNPLELVSFVRRLSDSIEPQQEQHP